MLAGEVTYPISVELDLSNTCPHDCPFCSFGTTASHGYRQTNWVTFPESRAVRLFDELRGVGVKAVTFTGGGEPLVHRRAACLIGRAAEVGLEVGVVTNGVGLVGEAQRVIAERATFVRISLDAGRPETHRFTHGTPTDQFDLIIEHLADTRRAADACGRPLVIGASFCVMDQNYKEIYAAAKLTKDAGGQYLEARPTFPTEWRGDGWGSALSEAHIEEAKTEIAHAQLHLNDASFQVIGMVSRFDAIAQPEKRYGKCRIGPLMTVIGAEQSLWHCCVQRGQPFFNMGSLKDQSFKEAWHAALARNMADQIDVTRCPRCRYDSYNTLIEQAFLGDALHASFV